MNKVLALTKDGKMSYCSAPPEKRGYGRCNHITHMLSTETPEDFKTRLEYLDLENYKEEKRDLVIEYWYDEKINPKLDQSSILGGSQPKFVLDDENIYIKVDSEEISANGNKCMKYSYPSIQEAISSCLIRNSDINTRLRCADYHFCIIRHNDGKKYTASNSVSYLKGDENELLLATNYSKSDSTLISGSDYREDVLNTTKNKSEELVNIIEKETGMPKNLLRQQFNDKCALDIILRNSDVSENPLNFCFALNKDNKVNIISMDYGRCLTDDIPNGYQMLNDDFDPFTIDLEGFKKESKEIINKANIVSEELGVYAQTVYNICLNSLEKNSNLWRS